MRERDRDKRPAAPQSPSTCTPQGQTAVSDILSLHPVNGAQASETDGFQGVRARGLQGFAAASGSDCSSSFSSFCCVSRLDIEGTPVNYGIRRTECIVFHMCTMTYDTVYDP